MATSADVAQHAGLSRSTVSQILNGREHLFLEETVTRVRAAAAELGYRPSMAGRTLARGTSDIVITLIPDITFNARLRELIDAVTRGLAEAGLTNLLRFVGSDDSLDSLEDAILRLKPFGVVSLAYLSDEQQERVLARGVRLVAQSAALQAAIDESFGRLQAEHLAASGYTTLAAVLPVSAREESFAAPREAGVRAWAREAGIDVIPTRHVTMERGGAFDAIRDLPAGPVGFAAYNDEVAAALLGAAISQGIDVPRRLGIIGIDNSPSRARRHRRSRRWTTTSSSAAWR
ncbi:LacI family DNA-binding transcriptional regulator [Clavibacter sepedonicus]|uniref:LacI family DNA-binding transcriptional regulator n=1 Tax=Clavibacter sepedonicus TaxID=31964 RepID=UPI001FF0B516|nr:LacI family DNA-binding transcriptional regulator [Clavibacter sepedonicus]